MKNCFKPGGTVSLMQGDMVGCTIECGSNEYGRWVYSKLAAKDERVITVIVAYQPCKVSKKHGNTTYHQQVATLQQEGRRLCPRDVFIQDLLQFLHMCHDKGKTFIIGGDFNEVLHVKSKLIKLCLDEKLRL
eukprot:13603550-Ditylum_brightwellii.AAC.1